MLSYLSVKPRMTEKEKIDTAVSSICRADASKDEAMLLMTPEANWETFLTPAPYAIALLGDLLLISAGTDFSLVEKKPLQSFKHIKHPESFRASLVQLCHSGWKAFNEAHTSMDQIRLHAGNVETHIKNAAKFLMTGTPQEVDLILPRTLGKVEKIANESVTLAKNIEDRFVFVMELTGELLEACTSTQGVYNEKARETDIAISIAKIEKDAANKEQEEMKLRLEKMKEDVDEAQTDFKDAVKNIPSGSELLGISALEGLVQGVRNITSIPGLLTALANPKDVAKQIIEMSVQNNDESAEQHVDYYESIDISCSKRKVYLEMVQINKYIQTLAPKVWGVGDAANPKPDLKDISQEGGIQQIEVGLKHHKDRISTVTKCDNLTAEVTKLCESGQQICEEMKSMSKTVGRDGMEDKLASISKQVESLRSTSEKLAAEAFKHIGQNPLDNKPPHLGKMPTQSTSGSAAQAEREEARFKVNLAQATLKDAKLRQDKSYQETRQASERLTKVLKEMETLDLQKVDFDVIRDLLVKGINAMADIRAQWGKLIRFFQMLANLIKCCLHEKLTDFVGSVKDGSSLKVAGIPLSDCFRDCIFEQARQANKVAFIVHAIARTYVQVSEQHLMDRVAALDRLIALDPKTDGTEIQQRKRYLHENCEKAQKAIEDLVIAEKETFNRQIDARMARIEREVGQLIPPLPPAREAEMQQCIETRFSPEIDI